MAARLRRLYRSAERLACRSLPVGAIGILSFCLEHDLFGKPDSTHRVMPEGMLFRIML
jgi:hypothetical protein